MTTLAQFDRLHDEMEARWHPSNPDLIRFVGGNSILGSLKLFEYSVSTGEITVLSDLSGKLPSHWGENLYGMTHLEGDFSADGHRLAWSIENSAEEPVGFVVFDVRNHGVVLGTLDYTAQNHDNISITPSGNYVVISGHQETAAYSVDFSSKRVLMAETQHGDTCTNALGNDCYVSIIFDDQSHEQIGKVFMVDLITGKVDSLIDVYGYGNTSLHLSGRAHDVPGWALMSTYNCLGNGVDTSTVATSLCDRLTLVELAPSPRLYQLAWTHSSGETYNAEPHGTISRDGTRAYFSSDWYSLKTNQDKAVDLYRVDIDPAIYAGSAELVEAPATPVDLLPEAGTRLRRGEPLMLSWQDRSPKRSVSFTLVSRDVGTAQTVSQTTLLREDICDADNLCAYSVDTSLLPSNTEVSISLVANGLRGSSDWATARYIVLRSFVPDVPQILSPVDGVDIDYGLSPLFRWQQNSHPDKVTEFEIILENADVSEEPLLRYASYSFEANCIDNQCRLIDTELELPEASGYQFRIRALNVGGYSDWASIGFSVEEGARGYIPYAEGIQQLKRPESEKPVLGQSYIDQSFYSTVTSVSDASKAQDIYGITVAKNDYSRVQVENADASKIMLLAMHPDHGVLSFALADPDGENLRFINFPPDAPTSRSWMHDESEPRWHPTDPDIIRFISGQNYYTGSLKIFEYRVSSGVVSVLANLEGKLPEAWGKDLYGMTLFEGGSSADGNRYAWVIEGGSQEKSKGFVSFDVREGGIVLGTLDYDRHNHDNIGISHTGKYVVISGVDETAAYSIDFSQKRVLLNEGQHADLCRLKNGHDCYVTVSFDDVSNENYGKVFYIDLQTGEETVLFDVFGLGNTSLHFSGRAYDVPGWVVVSTYNCSAGDSVTTSTALCDRILLVELAQEPKIYNIGWAHSSAEQYYSEPHASVSRDGQRVYFSSDWNSGAAIELYRIDVSPALYGLAIEPPQSAQKPTILAPLSKTPRDESGQLLVQWSLESLEGLTGFTIDIVDAVNGERLYTNTNVGLDSCNDAGQCELAVRAVEFPVSNSLRKIRIQGQGAIDSSDWTTADFQLYGIPDVPEIIAPREGETIGLNTLEAIEWVAEVDDVIEKYDIYVYDRTLKQHVLTEVGMDASSVCDADGQCRYPLPETIELPESRHHIALVRARNKLGVSDWSRSYFHVADLERELPPAATIVSPAGGSTLGLESAVELVWQRGTAANPQSQATGFDVYVYDRTLTQYVLTEVGMDASSVCDADGQCRYPLPETIELPESRHHIALVRSRNKLGVSDWSRSYFHVADLERELPPAATIVSPAGGSTLGLESAVELVWQRGTAANPQSQATGFDVYVYDRTLTQYVLTEVGMDASSVCDADGQCRYPLPETIELPESRHHIALVRARNKLGVSDWSRSYFHVADLERELPPAATIVSPAGGSTLGLESAVELVWQRGTAANPQSQATGFDVYVYDRTLTQYVLTEVGMDASSVCDADGQCRYPLPETIELPESRHHIALVRSRNKLGVSDWSRSYFHVADLTHELHQL